LHKRFRLPPVMLSIDASRQIDIANVAAVLEECLSRALGTKSRDTPKANHDDCESIVINHEETIHFKSRSTRS
jgi:hypothetical protein